MAALPGIDVSSHQGQPDWGQVAPVNWFAFAKASEGVGFTDPQWDYNRQRMSGLVAGAYHFARPDLGNAPEAEADWFWSRVTGFRGLLALDLEVGSGDLSGWRDRFCARLSQHAGGYVPGWYTFWNFALAHGLNRATPYWGWLAWPDANGAPPATAFGWVFQQYGSGPVPGITGSVDLNRFLGTPDDLRALIYGGFRMDYSLKLALVGLMYFAVLGRGPNDQPEADQWAVQIGDQGQNTWQVLEAIAATPEAKAYASPAGRLKALEASLKALTTAPVGQHAHPLTGVTGPPT